MQRIGIIDLGSNTVRLVVFDVASDFGKHLKHKEFQEVLNKNNVAGLSAYVKDGIFTEEGIEQAADVLEDHVVSARNVGCKKVYVFATAVLRNCSNSEAAVKEIEKRTGLKIDLISGEEEAHLGFVGASINLKMDAGTLVDIGGGSTEITYIEKGHDRLNESVPQGSVSSYANFVSVILPTPDECMHIRETFKANVAGCNLLSNINNAQMYGIGGSIRAVAKMVGKMNDLEKAPKQLSPSDVESVLQLLENDRSRFAHLAVKAAPDRLHSIVPGCIILQELIGMANAQKLTVSKYGVREGYLIKHVLG